ncbi:FAD-dependent oxidoreductase, partial [Enterococcus faecalis]
MAEQTDLLILGGGTGGYVAAIRAAQKGLKVTIVEKYKLGGTCLHKGCIPTKALLRSAEVFDTLKQAASFGIETEAASIDFSKIQQRKEGIIEQLHKGAVAVTFNDPTREEEIIVPKNVIIATGSSPKTLPNLPLDEEFILSSDGMLELEELPESIAIIGGGVIGVEWASLLNSLGVNVTIIEFLDRLLINESATISKELKKRLEQRGVNILLGSKVQEAKVTGQKVQVEVAGQETLTVDKVMVAIGRQPNVNKLGLQNTSVKYTDKGIEVNEFYQTTEGHIYAIGDCIDTLQLAHVAMKEGELAVQHLLGETVEPLNYTNVPRGVYTNPEIASVGYTRETLPADKEVV